MRILGHWSIPWGHLLTFVIGCWFGARWVRRYNVVMNRGLHQVLMDDLNYKTNALERLTGDDTGFVATTDTNDEDSAEMTVEVYVDDEGYAEDESKPTIDPDTRVCLD